MISGGYIWGRLRLAFTNIVDRLNYSCLVMCVYCVIFLSKFFHVLFGTFHFNKETTTTTFFTQNKETITTTLCTQNKETSQKQRNHHNDMFTQNKETITTTFSTTFFTQNKEYQRWINKISIIKTSEGT